jgi:signal recognition particle subunit SRP54
VFDTLSDRLQAVFKQLRGKGRLNETDVDEALRQVRIALLEADVNFRVVKEFLGRVRARAVGADVLESLTPAQVVIKIVNEELIATLGEPAKIDLSASPAVVMLVGLQGSGKTTTAAKLALSFKKTSHRPLLVAADVRRPAAIEQLITLGKQVDVAVHSEANTASPPDICRNAVKRAKDSAYDVVILDTAGRLHIDDDLMQELEQVKRKAQPQEVLLVADAMTGQDAVRVAEEFHKRIGLTGLILTKVDGDARGGAALSIRAVTGVPIKYLAVGEKTDALEPFYPDRLASRILGMGDVLSLIEKAQATFDQKQAEELQEKLAKSTFDLEDFRDQLRQVKKMGPLSQVMEMIPGFSKMAKQPELDDAVTDKQLRRVEAMINSMTREERHNPQLIDGRRKRRIAAGSGTSPQEINALLSQFQVMRKMMKQMTAQGGMGGKGGKGGMPSMPGMPGMPGLPPGFR